METPFMSSQTEKSSIRAGDPADGDRPDDPARRLADLIGWLLARRWIAERRLDAANREPLDHPSADAADRLRNSN